MKQRLESMIIALCMVSVCLLPAAAVSDPVFAYDPTVSAQEQPDTEDPSEPEAEDPTDPSGTEDPTEPTQPTTTQPATTQSATTKPSATKPSTTKATTTKATTTTVAPRKDPIPVLTSAKAGYRSITLNWLPVKNAVGYEIYFKQADKKKQIQKVSAVDTATLTDLKCGKKYKIKVRSIKKKKDGTKVRSKWSESKSATVFHTDWAKLKEKYQKKDKVNELIFVRYKGGSKAELLLYEKTSKGKWKLLLNCPAYVGKKGINKKKEGDKKTPRGQYDITAAFGIKADPGSKMEYTKINKHHYWCSDKYYNQMIDLRDKPHNCSGEHLINYTKQYAYAMNIGYNTDGEKDKGAAIFLHCFGNYDYTLGCVAVSKTNMIKLLQTCGDGTRICIYRR